MINTPSDEELKELLPTVQLDRNQDPKVQVWLTQKDAIEYARAVLAKWGTPQPVVREPLTDEQLAEMMRDKWGCASIAPRHALAFARSVERAHGITQKGGGQ